MVDYSNEERIKFSLGIIGVILIVVGVVLLVLKFLGIYQTNAYEDAFLIIFGAILLVAAYKLSD